MLFHIHKLSCSYDIISTKYTEIFSPAVPVHSYAGSEGVACDICTGKRMRAVKNCLTCSVAYCETHVRQHYTVEALQRHTLIETDDLETRTCLLHHRALEAFCKNDQLFICLVCVMEEHKGHDTLLVKGGSCAARVCCSLNYPVLILLAVKNNIKRCSRSHSLSVLLGKITSRLAPSHSL